MVSKFLFTVSLFFISSVCFSQVAQPGSKAWMQNQRNYDPSVLNGNDTLATIFDSTGCGLNFTTASQKLGMRLPLLNSPSVAQPAPFSIYNLPTVAHIDRAYLWFVTAGNGIADTVTITNPVGTTQTFPVSIIGQSIDMCWGYTGTYTYRVDVTSIINGNGIYIISGIPTNPPVVGNDADGATLMIIYDDPSATYTGSLHIDDGCIASNGTGATDNMTGFNSCSNSTYADAFMIVADLQNIGTQLSINNGPNFTVNEDWWNMISFATNIFTGQTSCPFTVNSTTDCFCLAVTGLYTQTTCNTCVASVADLDGSLESLLITPNPNNGNFQLTMTLGHAQIVNVSVFNNLGQNVYAKQENVGAGNVAVTMNLSTLSAGVYFVQVKIGNGIATKRLVIQ